MYFWQNSTSWNMASESIHGTKTNCQTFVAFWLSLVSSLVFLPFSIFYFLFSEKKKKRPGHLVNFGSLCYLFSGCAGWFLLSFQFLTSFVLCVFSLHASLLQILCLCLLSFFLFKSFVQGQINIGKKSGWLIDTLWNLHSALSVSSFQ